MRREPRTRSWRPGGPCRPGSSPYGGGSLHSQPRNTQLVHTRMRPHLADRSRGPPLFSTASGLVGSRVVYRIRSWLVCTRPASMRVSQRPGVTEPPGSAQKVWVRGRTALLERVVAGQAAAQAVERLPRLPQRQPHAPEEARHPEVRAQSGLRPHHGPGQWAMHAVVGGYEFVPVRQDRGSCRPPRERCVVSLRLD
jgi:hypothetical protein